MLEAAKPRGNGGLTAQQIHSRSLDGESLINFVKLCWISSSGTSFRLKVLYRRITAEV